METVRQFDQDDADILGHGHEHLPQVLRLHLDLVLVVIQLGQLGDAVHKMGHVRPKLLLQLGKGHSRILHHVVKEGCSDGLLIHLQVCQDNGNAEGMDDIGLPGAALLAGMLPVRHLIGLPDHGKVFRGMVTADSPDQVLIKDLRLRKGGRFLQLPLAPELGFVVRCHGRSHLGPDVGAHACPSVFFLYTVLAYHICHRSSPNDPAPPGRSLP